MSLSALQPMPSRSDLNDEEAEAAALKRWLALVKVGSHADVQAALRDGVCCHLASFLWKCGTPSAVCEQFGIECDLLPAERDALSREPPSAPSIPMRGLQ